MTQIPNWLYRPVDINAQEVADIQLELFEFLKKLCQSKHTTVDDLTTQFIAITCQDTFFDNFKNLHRTNSVLSRMQLDKFIIAVCFIVVKDNKYFPIHIDHYNTEWMNVGLNIPILNCEGSKTVWYDSIPDENDDMPDYIGSITKISTSVSVKCVQDNVKEIGSCDANIPHWINIAMPHAPRCNHSKLRINASLRFNFLENNFINSPEFEQFVAKKTILT